MPGVLICASERLQRQLTGTAVWRDDLERHVVASAAEALRKAATVRPRLVVVDRDVTQAEALVRQIRSGAETRVASIVIVAEGEMTADELGLLDVGANAVLRLPAGPEWDTRIEALLHVPTRKQTRLSVQLAFDGEFNGNELRGRILNVSTTGVLVETASALEVGSELSLRFELPGFEASSGEIEGRARVVRTAGSGRFGLKFLTLAAYDREKLRRFLLVP